jgi:SWI/SNF-related matrix-associated actin-dependent regulator 1 of chromatin subfamily A
MKVQPNTYNTFTLTHDSYSPAMFEAARAIPGCAKFSSKAIAGSPDAIACAIQYMVKKKGLNPIAFQGRDLLIPKTKFAHGGQWYEPRLREYQKDAVLFLKSTKRAILADDMGLGKTASAINAAMSFITSKRVLIVPPSYVRGVWMNPHDKGELGKWGMTGSVYECRGIKVKGDEPLNIFNIIICHYDILHAWADILKTWNPEVVIFDECHYLMNPETKRTKAAKLVSKDADYVWGLSGTPMTNRPRDLWGILDTIVPDRFGSSFFNFGLRYCGAEKQQVTPEKVVWNFDGKSRLPELRDRLNHIMLRRTKTDVALELPAKTRQAIRVDISKPGALVASISNTTAFRAALAVAADAKLKDSAIPLIQSHLDAGSKVVVFTYRRAVADYLARELGGSVIHGGVSQATRERTLFGLRISGAESSSLLCATIDAASTGIDLSYADVAVFVELTYEPHELLQAEARLHRFGQKNPVLIQYLIARGTADELVAEVVLSKLDALESTIGGFAETGMRSDLSESEDSIMKQLYASLGLT